MKLTNETLKQIIKEELQKVMNESLESSDLVYKIEQLVLSGREGYNQAEALVDYALPMMNPQDADYIDAIFQAGKAQKDSDALTAEIKDSLNDGTYEEKKSDFSLRAKQIDEQYFSAMDNIEDMKDIYVRRKLHRMFRSF
tara:strand:- start:474 stop:893 length:420 start_codon:yes stop_codon:yes gene_type:complete